ncbi:hypothetical protein B0H12DRAFT_1321275 [Mycena haematopus]|nr:hypothetical protein B0H12DRAFT_1321275 [Mycena haematopus]
MASSGRRTHRKRVSALRLSSDTTSTLPEYVGWRDLVPPPEYEADADAEEDTDPPAPLDRSQYHYRRAHRRRTSSPPQQQDVLLDSLLERSVHALELSNALLQSSLAEAPSPSMPPEPSLSRRTIMPPPREPAWADDLAAIARDVDELLVSSSLPASVSPVAARKPPRRRPSLDPAPASSHSSRFSPRSASPTASNTSYTSTTSLTSASTGTGTGLRIAPAARQRLVAPAPRALTQYVAAGGHDDDHIALPSTLGLRAPSSEWSPSLDDEYTYHPGGYHSRAVRSPQIDGLPSPALSPSLSPHPSPYPYSYAYTFPRDRDRPRDDPDWVTVGARDWAPDAAAALRSVSAGVGVGVPRASSVGVPRPSRSAYAPTLPNIAGSLPTIASLSLASLSPKLLGGPRARGGSASPKMGVQQSGVGGTPRRGRSESRNPSGSGSRSRGGTPRGGNGLSQSTPDLHTLPSPHPSSRPNFNPNTQANPNFTLHPNSSQIIASLPSESPAHSLSSSGGEDAEGAGPPHRPPNPNTNSTPAPRRRARRAQHRHGVRLAPLFEGGKAQRDAAGGGKGGGDYEGGEECAAYAEGEDAGWGAH